MKNERWERISDNKARDMMRRADPQWFDYNLNRLNDGYEFVADKFTLSKD